MVSNGGSCVSPSITVDPSPAVVPPVADEPTIAVEPPDAADTLVLEEVRATVVGIVWINGVKIEQLQNVVRPAGLHNLVGSKLKFF